MREASATGTTSANVCRSSVTALAAGPMPSAELFLRVQACSRPPTRWYSRPAAASTCLFPIGLPFACSKQSMSALSYRTATRIRRMTSDCRRVSMWNLATYDSEGTITFNGIACDGATCRSCLDDTDAPMGLNNPRLTIYVIQVDVWPLCYLAQFCVPHMPALLCTATQSNRRRTTVRTTRL